MWTAPSGLFSNVEENYPPPSGWALLGEAELAAASAAERVVPLLLLTISNHILKERNILFQKSAL